MNNSVEIREEGRKNVKNITLFAICFLVLGFFSAVLTGDSSLYGEINMPPLSPPPAVFAIVWSILYVLIGGTFGAVYSYETSDVTSKRDSLVWMAIGFVFNLLWYPLFFGKGEFVASLVDLIVIILLNIVAFAMLKNVRKLYSNLLIPYLIWLFFALYLNIGVVILN